MSESDLKEDKRPGSSNQLCCCPPIARVLISNSATAFAVENSIQEDFSLDRRQQLNVSSKVDAAAKDEARAMSNAAVRPPGGPDVNADSMGAARASSDSDGDSGSSLDEQVKKIHTVRKDQAKVYRIDQWVIEWEARGDGDLRVSLEVSGFHSYFGDWLRKSDKLTFADGEMMHPPDYRRRPGRLQATLRVVDCHGQAASYTAIADRPA